MALMVIDGFLTRARWQFSQVSGTRESQAIILARCFSFSIEAAVGISQHIHGAVVCANHVAAPDFFFTPWTTILWSENFITESL